MQEIEILVIITLRTEGQQSNAQQNQPRPTDFFAG